MVLLKRRNQIEENLIKNPCDYESWFDYVRLEEQCEEVRVDAIRDVYERAISNKPASDEKQAWRRYIYLWLNYAVFEEQTTQDIERARAVYEKSL